MHKAFPLLLVSMIYHCGTHAAPAEKTDIQWPCA